MGTRSTTTIHEMKSLDEEEKPVCRFYRHWDGYLSGHGQDLADWLKDKVLVNGWSSNSTYKKNEIHFNRAGQMAPYLMIALNCDAETMMEFYGQEYNYDIYYRDGKFLISVDGSKPILCSEFNGKEIEDFETEYEDNLIDLYIRSKEMA